MAKRTLIWQGLNYMQALDVMRQATTLTAAVFDGDAPYLAVMDFQLEMDGVRPVVHLSTAGESRIAQGLRVLPRMALLFRLDSCTGTDTVLAEGTAALIEADGGVYIQAAIGTLSARRYFLTEEDAQEP